jgi:hypothetical protein
MLIRSSRSHEDGGLRLVRGKLLLFAVAAVALSGCGANPVTTWSAQFPSPDGKWTAVARTYRYSGPGNDYVDTRLYLRSDYEGKKEEMVLEYVDIGKEMSVVWTAPSHLQVTLRKHVDIDFETVIFSTVTITVRNPSA